MLRRYQILKGQFSAVLIDMLCVYYQRCSLGIEADHFCSAFVVQAILNGTIFFRLKNTTASFYSRGGVLFLYVQTSVHHTTGYQLMSSRAQCYPLLRIDVDV